MTEALRWACRIRLMQVLDVSRRSALTGFPGLPPAGSWRVPRSSVRPAVAAGFAFQPPLQFSSVAFDDQSAITACAATSTGMLGVMNIAVRGTHIS